MRTPLIAPIRYVPFGRPCVLCSEWAWNGNQVSETHIEIQRCYCQKAHRSLNVVEVKTKTIPRWCPNVLHIMVASGEQN